MPGFHLAPIAYDQIADWPNDHQADALVAFRRSCAKIDGKRSVGNGAMGWQFGGGGHWLAACRAAATIAGDDRSARRFFEQWFAPYLVLSAGSDEGMFTGYYEPILFGSWRRTARHTYPLYRAPAAGRGCRAAPKSRTEHSPAAAWNSSGSTIRSKHFSLHIQGSGLVQLEDGSVYRVGFAGQNGYSYFPIGRELIRRGEIPPEQMSMQAIRLWLQAHPDEAPALMNLNPSYVFFRLRDGDAPIGAQGVMLTPGRSLAVDPSFVPYGVPIWLDTTDPVVAYSAAPAPGGGSGYRRRHQGTGPRRPLLGRRSGCGTSRRPDEADRSLLPLTAARRCSHKLSHSETSPARSCGMRRSPT